MITAIICAAGKGERAGFESNKILQELNGMPVLDYSLCAFAPFADELLVTCRREDEGNILPLLSPYPNARICYGGKTRCESVYSALREAHGEIVLIHDAARPFVTAQIIQDCIDSVKKYGSGVCALPATDTVVLAKDNRIIETPKREGVFTLQTPQGFFREPLMRAYQEAFAAKRQADFTDDSGIYATYAESPCLFIGDRCNKKLTFREDFLPAPRVGFGIDTHAFGADKNYIVLGGIRIPSRSGLIAHSDGDVLVHALMDALLSAAGLFDIGTYFPDTDKAYEGADSMLLLKRTLSLIKEQGYLPQNVSISVLAENPRLSPYIIKIKQNIASALGVPPTAVGIAAGTNEKLGYVGAGKGITVYAMISLKEVRN